jgi:hypothetical protein
MSTVSPLTARASNVYYLTPSAEAPVRTPRLSRRLVFRLRVLATWWRLRLTAVEMWDVLRRFGRPDVPVDSAFLEQRAEIILAATPRPLGPARVIDFETARVRLRG